MVGFRNIHVAKARFQKGGARAGNFISAVLIKKVTLIPVFI